MTNILSNGFVQISPTSYNIVIPYTDDIRYYFTLFCDIIKLVKVEPYDILQVEINVGVPFNVIFAPT